MTTVTHTELTDKRRMSGTNERVRGSSVIDSRRNRPNQSERARSISKWSMRLDEIDGFRLVVHVRGDLGSLSRRSLEEFYAELESTVLWSPPAMILDLTQVNSFGASLLGIIAVLNGLFRQRGGQLIVCGDSQGLVARSGLRQQIPTFATRDWAVSYAARITM